MASMQQTYEDFKPLVEEKDTPEALLLLVHLPGFTREQVGASFEADSRKIRVFGEKPIDNNKRKRFKEEYVVPENCDSDKLKGKFDKTVITITIPKKPISIVTPEEPKPAQETAKQVTPPTSTSGVEAERDTKKDEKDASQEKPKPEMESQREADKKKDETQVPPEATTGETEKPQKDKEEIPQKGKLDDEKKDEEVKKAEKERIQEDKRKTSKAGKEPQKVHTLAREEDKDKGSSGLKTHEERKKEKDVKAGKVSQSKESELPIAKCIKDIANSASQAVTRLADRFKEEDKQKLLYAGAAILMVAVGIYASIKLRSTGRQ